MVKRNGNKGETTLYKTLHRKAKYRATQTPLKFRGCTRVLRVSGGSCSTSDARRVSVYDRCDISIVVCDTDITHESFASTSIPFT